MYRLLPIVAWFLASPALAQVTLYPAKSGDTQARTVMVYSSLDEPLAQPMIEAFQTANPDIAVGYEDLQTAIYVDGPHHDYPDRRRRDQERTEAMEDQGWTVIRFGHKDDWGSIVAQYAHVFGKASE